MADALAFDNIRAYFQESGKTAYLAGHSRDSHDLNPGAAAIADFHAGWDAAASVKNIALAGGRVDAYHGSEP